MAMKKIRSPSMKKRVRSKSSNPANPSPKCQNSMHITRHSRKMHRKRDYSKVDADEDAIRYTPSGAMFKPRKRTRNNDVQSSIKPQSVSKIDHSKDVGRKRDDEPSDMFLKRREVARTSLDKEEAYNKAISKASRKHRGNIPRDVRVKILERFYPSGSASKPLTDQSHRDRSITPVADRGVGSNVSKGQIFSHAEVIVADAELVTDSEEELTDSMDEYDEAEERGYDYSQEAALEQQDHWNDFSNDPLDESRGFQRFEENHSGRLHKATEKAPKSLIELHEASAEYKLRDRFTTPAADHELGSDNDISKGHVIRDLLEDAYTGYSSDESYGSPPEVPGYMSQVDAELVEPIMASTDRYEGSGRAQEPEINGYGRSRNAASAAALEQNYGNGFNMDLSDKVAEAPESEQVYNGHSRSYTPESPCYTPTAPRYLPTSPCSFPTSPCDSPISLCYSPRPPSYEAVHESVEGHRVILGKRPRSPDPDDVTTTMEPPSKHPKITHTKSPERSSESLRQNRSTKRQIRAVKSVKRDILVDMPLKWRVQLCEDENGVEYHKIRLYDHLVPMSLPGGRVAEIHMNYTIGKPSDSASENDVRCQESRTVEVKDCSEANVHPAQRDGFNAAHAAGHAEGATPPLLHGPQQSIETNEAAAEWKLSLTDTPQAMDHDAKGTTNQVPRSKSFFESIDDEDVPLLKCFQEPSEHEMNNRDYWRRIARGR